MKHFFDIGANVGQTFDYLATLDRDFTDYKFWLFEPSPRHLASLIKRCETVNYETTICPFGIGRMSRSETFYEKDDILGDSFMQWHASDHAPSNRIASYSVRSAIVSLADVLTDCTDWDDDVILDIDAEGAEYEILDCLIRFPRLALRVKEVWVEWHSIKPLPELNRAKFSAWCDERGVSVTHRGFA